MSEPTKAEAPNAATAPRRRCICPSFDPYDCAAMRYGLPYDADRTDEPCGCACHEEYDDQD